MFVGIGGSVNPTTLALTDGSVGIAASATSVTVALQASKYGVDVEGLQGRITGVPETMLAVSGVNAIVNPDAVDWHSLDPSIAMDGTVTLAASGSVDQLDLLNLLTGSAMFSFTRATVDADVDGTAGFNPTTDISGANLITFGLGSLHLSLGTPGFGLAITGGTIALVELAPSDTSDARRWFAVEANALTGSLTLPIVNATASELALAINSATGSDSHGNAAQALNWTMDVGTYNGTAFTPQPPTVGSITIDLNGATSLAISGDVTLAIAGFISGSAHFSLTQGTVSLDLNGDGTADVTGASLLTFGLTNLMLTIGAASGPHVTASGGTLALAAIEAPAPTAGATDTRSWLAIEGTLTGATFVSGIADLGLTVTNLAIQINEASGAYTNGSTQIPAQPLNWTTALDLNVDNKFGTAADQLSPAGVPLDLTAGVLAVSGVASVQLFGLLSGQINFAFQQQTVSVDVDRDGTLELPVVGTAWARGPPGPDLNDATLTTLGLSIASGQSLVVGVGGVGFSVTSGSLALAILTPSAADQSAGDARQWLALEAQSLDASFTGIPDLHLTVSGLTLDLNRSTGAYTDPTSHTPISTQALDWTKSVGTSSGTTFTKQPVTVGGIAVNLTGVTSLQVAGTATVSFDNGLISGTALFALQTQTVSVKIGTAAPFSASLTTVSLSATSLFVGFDGVGFTVTGGGLAIASLTPTDTSDTRSWTAVQADLSAGSLTIPGLTITASSLKVGLNSATNASALDWTQDVGSVNATTHVFTAAPVAILDPGGVTHTFAFTGDTQLQISGSASIDIAGLLSGSASFTFTKSTLATPVTLSDGQGTLSDTNGALLTFGLSNLQLAVGTTSIGAQITGTSP